MSVVILIKKCFLIKLTIVKRPCSFEMEYLSFEVFVGSGLARNPHLSYCFFIKIHKLGTNMTIQEEQHTTLAP